MTVTHLTSAAEVLVATDHDPYVRGRLARTDVEGWTGHGATAWRYTYPGETTPMIMSVGDPHAVALLLEALLPDLRDGQEVNVPRGIGALLPAWVGLEVHAHWDVRWTDTPPPVQPREEDVRPAEDAEVSSLLEVANPTASARPGDTRVRRWLGVEGPAGLLACGADTSVATGVGHLSSIATHPDARGQGLGAAVTAALIRSCFADGCDVVTLGMYAGNTAGKALYDRLAMKDEHHFTSGTLRIRSRW